MSGSDVSVTPGSTQTDSEVALNYSIAQSASAGNYNLTFSDRFGASAPATFSVGDDTPIISGITPSVWPAGQTTQVTFVGQHFGTNAPVLGFSDSSITYAISTSTDGQIVANVTVPASTPNENVDVAVTSTGYGGNGFMPAPGQSGPASSATATVTNGGGECFAQLKFRPVPHLPPPLSANHSFWYIQDSDGVQWIIDGSPSGTCPGDCGNLIDWVTEGTVSSHFNAEPSLDSSGKTTAWSIGPASGQLCEQVDTLYQISSYYWPPGGDIPYSITGPNSNSFAWYVGVPMAEFDITTPPPNVPGWGSLQ